MNIKPFARVTPGVAYALCALVLWLATFAMLRSVVGAMIDMRLDSPRAGVAQWYLFRSAGFADVELVSVALRAGSNDVRFRVPPGTFTALRFDPIDNDATVVVRSMNWHLASGHGGFVPSPRSLVPLDNIASLVPSSDGGAVAVPKPGTNNPQLLLPLSAPLVLEPMRSAWRDALAAAMLSVFLTALIRLAHRRIGTRTLIVVGMFLVGGLIIGLACMSAVGVAHPDERAHAFVFEYLTEHVLPPAADDPGTRWTLSTFGYSYLFELNVTYWIAARTMAPFASLFATPEHAARIFQCLLWLVLACVALRRKRGTIALGVLFLSPQMWYVFAYFNGDALPLMFAFLAVLLSAPEASVHAFIEGRASWRSSAALALCLGLLLVSKANYLPLVPGILLWLAVVHLELSGAVVCAVLAALALLGARVFMAGSPAFSESALLAAAGVGGAVLLVAAAFFAIRRCWSDATLRSRLLRVAGLFALALLFAAPRVAEDLYVNGSPSTKAARIEAVEEANARPDLRPSVVATGHGGEGTGLVMQKVGFGEMLFGPYYAWVARNTTTALGVYGYLNILAPSAMYGVQLAVVLLCALMVALALRSAEPRRYVRLLLVAAGTSFLVVESSALHSWIDAFQPQGRYLFPLFAMLAMMVVYAEGRLPRAGFRLLLASALVISMLSFVFVALPAFGAGD